MARIIQIKCSLCSKPTGDEMIYSEYVRYARWVTATANFPHCQKCEMLQIGTLAFASGNGWGNNQPPITNRGVTSLSSGGENNE